MNKQYKGGFFLVATAVALLLLGTPRLGPVRAEEADNLSEIKEQIEEINDQVAKKQREMQQLDKKSSDFRTQIMQKKLESASIEDQLSLLDNEIAKTQIDISIAKDQIRSLNLQISSLDDRIAEHEKKISYQKSLLGSLARRLHRAEFRRSALEILLTHDSFSGFFDELRTISDLQGSLDKALTSVKKESDGLTQEKKEREDGVRQIAARQAELEEAKTKLDDNRLTKESLLAETKASELEYRYRLGELQRQQGDADSEITYLEKVLRERKNVADQLAQQNAVLAWPLVPARGLSTKFHDIEYPFRYVFEHPGIDIRAGQGTPVRASAAGVVARAKNAGLGYSYVMVLHYGNIATVYGHLTKIMAKEDAFVDRGEIIGYSGGMPGTAGAGPLTTGPHLHFETRVGGIPVDPMRFLVMNAQ